MRLSKERKKVPPSSSENNKRGRWPCYVFREIICVRCRSNAPDDFVIEKVVKAYAKVLNCKDKRDISRYDSTYISTLLLHVWKHIDLH